MNQEIATAKLRSLATYLDINPAFGQETQGDLVFDRQAISAALRNLFATSPGEAGPIFEPEFGSLLPLLIHEPFDDITAEKIRAATIQAVQRWEPRVEIDFSFTRIDKIPELPGYEITLVYKLRYSGENGLSRFQVRMAQ